MNKILLILGLGGLFYYIKKKNAPVNIDTTPAPTTDTKPTTGKPKKATTEAPIVPPPFKLNDVLIPRPPRTKDTAYALPFGKVVNETKEGLYLGYSSQYKNWIKIRTTFYTGVYGVPTTQDVWVKLNNWIKK